MSRSHQTPPKQLDLPSEIGPGDWGNRNFCHLVTGLVIPRPIGWISTISAARTLNVASMRQLEAMNFTSADVPRDRDEFEWLGLAPVPSAKVRPPRFGKAPAHQEDRRSLNTALRRRSNRRRQAAARH